MSERHLQGDYIKGCATAIDNEAGLLRQRMASLTKHFESIRRNAYAFSEIEQPGTDGETFDAPIVEAGANGVDVIGEIMTRLTWLEDHAAAAGREVDRALAAKREVSQ